MNKRLKISGWIFIFLVLFRGISVSIEIQSGTGRYSNGDYVNFEQSFSKHPVIITSASKKGVALRVASISSKKNRFKLSILDYEGNKVSDACVQWLAAGLGNNKDIQAGSGIYNNGEYINFTQSFSTPPIVIASARKGQFAINTYVEKVEKRGFHIKLYNRFAPEKDAIVHWIAIAPLSNGNIQGQVGKYDNNQFIKFNIPFSNPPIILATGQKDGKAINVCATNNSKTGFTISLYDHKNKPVSNSDVQWIALGSTEDKSASSPPVLSFVEKNTASEFKEPSVVNINYEPGTTKQLNQPNYSEFKSWHSGQLTNSYEYVQVDKENKCIFIGVGVPGEGVGDVYAYGNLGVEINLIDEMVGNYPVVIRIKGSYNGQYLIDLPAGGEVRLSLEAIDLTTSATLPSYIIPPANDWTWIKPSGGDLTGQFDFQTGYILTTGHRYRIYLKVYLHTWLNTELQPISSNANIKFCNETNFVKYDSIEVTF